MTPKKIENTLQCFDLILNSRYVRPYQKWITGVLAMMFIEATFRLYKRDKKEKENENE